MLEEVLRVLCGRSEVWGGLQMPRLPKLIQSFPLICNTSTKYQFGPILSIPCPFSSKTGGLFPIEIPHIFFPYIFVYSESIRTESAQRSPLQPNIRNITNNSRWGPFGFKLPDLLTIKNQFFALIKPKKKSSIGNWEQKPWIGRAALKNEREGERRAEWAAGVETARKGDGGEFLIFSSGLHFCSNEIQLSVGDWNAQVFSLDFKY